MQKNDLIGSPQHHASQIRRETNHECAQSQPCDDNDVISYSHEGERTVHDGRDPRPQTPTSLRAVVTFPPNSTITKPSRLSELLGCRHLPALDGLRACAVFVVMAYHFGFSTIPGDLGVTAFFVLSGFLITWLLLKEFDRSNTVSLRDFYMRRLLRIFPAYYVFLAVSLGFDHYRGDPRVHDLVLPGVTYLMNYYNALHGHPPTSIAHAWSLAIEEQFYLLWPALFLVLVRRPARQAVAVLVGLVTLFAAWRSFLFLTGRVTEAYAYNAFDTRADILALGCLLAFAARIERVGVWCGRLTASSALPLITAGLLILSRTRGSRDYHYSVGFTIDALLVAILIVQILLLHDRRLWRWLDHPVLRYLGAISYPLYLYHIWGFGLARKLVPAGPILARAAAAVVASIILASLSYYAVERPFMRLKARFSTNGATRGVRSWRAAVAPP